MSLPWHYLARGPLPDEGPVAFDSDLSAENVHAAALAGFYCFPTSSYEQALLNDIRYGADVESGVRWVDHEDPDPYAVAWLNPDPRPIIDLKERRVGRSMRRLARRRTDWRTTIDRAFNDVVAKCAQHHTGVQGTTWITAPLREALRDLHRIGIAHSCEVWDGDQLIGGAFGLQLGAAFTADSQFIGIDGAGKLAVTDLMIRFAQGGGMLFDLQHDTAHARSLGAIPMQRPRYLDALPRLTTGDAVIHTERRSAGHIAELVSV